MNNVIAAFIVCIIFGSVIFIIGGLVYFVDSSKCMSKWEQSYVPEYGFWSRCTIMVNGHRIPSENYRVL